MLTQAQILAAARNAGSYIAGGLTVAVAFHVLSPMQSADITENVNTIVEGATKIATGIAGLIGILTPIYTAWRASKSASPSEQVKSVVNSLNASPAQQSANAIADPTSRQKLIEAVAEMPEVKKVVPVDPDLAVVIPSEKVVKA